MNKWTIYTTERFEKKFKKLDKSVQKQIVYWIKTHIVDCDDPRVYGKPLEANLRGYWRYRIGDYRLIVEINDNELKIIQINIGHRGKIYK